MASGTGLGLSIVRSLVRALNGSISVHSRPGEGTVVKITLSLAHASEGQREKTELAGTPNHKNARAAIFGVGPESTPRRDVISRYLTEWYGLELVSWPAHRVDILLADGRELAASKSGLTAVPALLILSSQPVQHEALRSEWSSLASFLDVICQPCGPHKLGKSISRALNNSGGQRIPKLHTTNLPERSRSNTLGSLDDTPVPVQTPKEEAGGPRVLVVDDNAINLNLMLTFLQKRNLPTLHSVDNGCAAVQAVEQADHAFDVIFMDISMPVMDGFEATRAIRALEERRQAAEGGGGEGGGGATIVALTGLSSPRDESEALASGVDLFLTKPVSFKEVGRVLGEWARKPRL